MLPAFNICFARKATKLFAGFLLALSLDFRGVILTWRYDSLVSAASEKRRYSH